MRAFRLLIAAAAVLLLTPVAAHAAKVTSVQTAQCTVDDGIQSPSTENVESPEYATVRIDYTGLNNINNKLRGVGISMSYSDDEPDTATVTVLGITSSSGNPADFAGVGNSASGPADGTLLETSAQLRATTGNTYSITVQCGEAGTPPQSQNQVVFNVSVPPGH